jgi:prepilin-type N-terminal cleavage/methylation domain-containing protein
MRNGFTLIEIIVVIGLIGVLFALAAFSFGTLRSTSALNNAQAIVVQTLQDAHNRSATGVGTSTYGVHITNGAVVEFSGASYVAGEGTQIPLPLTVTTDQASTTIIFSRITATASASTTIVLNGGSAGTKKVEVLASGAVLND